MALKFGWYQHHLRSSFRQVSRSTSRILLSSEIIKHGRYSVCAEILPFLSGY